MNVSESCTHYTFESAHNTCAYYDDSRQITSADGSVHFSAKYVWFGAGSRVGRTVLSYALLIAHGSVGRRVYLLTGGDGFQEHVIDIDPENPRTEITVTSEAIDRNNFEVYSSR
jgi:hypothetical protein